MQGAQSSTVTTPGEPTLLKVSSLTETGPGPTEMTSEVTGVTRHHHTNAGRMELYDTEGFADPDQALSLFDKINFGVLVTFLYSTFFMAVGLAGYYNTR